MAKATYVSVWDAGEVRTPCEIDLSQTPPAVSNVGEAELGEQYNMLEREYVKLENGTEIDTFQTEDYLVKNGDAEHED